MEKIKQQSMLALDRISMNQERYRQQHGQNGSQTGSIVNGQAPVSSLRTSSKFISRTLPNPIDSTLTPLRG